MKIDRIVYANFKGIKQFELNLDSKNVSVFGDNATGKSSLYDGFCWLLFGKDSLNQSDFEIKPIGANNLETLVEAAFDDGTTLKKVLSEKWTKKRGTATKEFTGHQIDHFINDVPVKKSEFDDMVKAIGSQEKFRLLTDPLFFNEQMHWQARRTILLHICDNVSDADVYSGAPEFNELPAILQGRNIVDFKKIITLQRQGINKEIEKMPTRIDEVNKAIASTIADLKPLQELNDAIVSLKAQIEVKNQEIVKASTGQELIEKTKELRQLESELLEHNNKENKRVMDAKSTLLNERIVCSTEIKMLNDTLSVSDKKISASNKELLSLREDWARTDSNVFEVSGICPTCKQDLPVNMLEESKANFNQEKARLLALISAKGKEEKTKLQTYKIEHEAAKAKLDEFVKKFAKINIDLDAIIPMQANEELNAKIAQINNEIFPLKEGIGTSTEPLKKEIAGLNQQLSKCQLDVAKYDSIEQLKERIKRLEQEEKKLAIEFETTEKHLNLVDMFIRKKVGLVTDRINGHFKLAKFKMFDTQINGGMAECCDSTLNGVPYNTLNSAAKVQIGLDIIRTLQEFNKVNLPVWIDGKESVTTIPLMECQIISLIVSEKDKQLRIEKE